MTNVSSAASYDAIPGFGALYDALPLYAMRGDVPFYVEEARRRGGSVLELGCGTGRVLLPLARAGVRVTGIDGSQAMLEQCRAKLATEPASVQEQTDVHFADSRDFALGRTYALVVAPFRLFQQLVTIDDQLRCLDAAARHLAPGGCLIFDVFNPNFAMLVKDRTTEQVDTPTLTMSDGRTLRRALRVGKVRWTEQVSEMELVYYVAARAGAVETRHVHAFDMRWYLRAELEHLLARSGFRVEAIHGDFDRSAHGDDSQEMIVSATRA